MSLISDISKLDHCLSRIEDGEQTRGLVLRTQAAVNQLPTRLKTTTISALPSGLASRISKDAISLCKRAMNLIIKGFFKRLWRATRTVFDKIPGISKRPKLEKTIAKTLHILVSKVDDAPREADLRRKTNCLTLDNNDLTEDALKLYKEIEDPGIKEQTRKEFLTRRSNNGRPLHIARGKYSLTTDQKLAKNLAHVFSIEDHKQLNAGYESHFVEAANWPSQIAPHCPNPQLKAALEKTSEYIKSTNFQATLDSIQQRELTILPYGYLGHSTSLTFYDGLLIHCDRSKPNTLRVYEIDPSLLTIMDLAELEFLQNEGTNTEANQFLDQLIEKIGLPPSERVAALEAKAPRKQSVGNCSYASIEGAIIASSALLNIDTAFLDSFKLSKTEEYLAGTKEIDTYLVNMACYRIRLSNLTIDEKAFPHLFAYYNERREKYDRFAKTIPNKT